MGCLIRNGCRGLIGSLVSAVCSVAFLFGEDYLCVQSLMSSVLTVLCVHVSVCVWICINAPLISCWKLSPARLPSAALRSVHLFSNPLLVKHFFKNKVLVGLNTK